MHYRYLYYTCTYDYLGLNVYFLGPGTWSIRNLFCGVDKRSPIDLLRCNTVVDEPEAWKLDIWTKPSNWSVSDHLHGSKLIVI